jgi:CRP/FNR family transcriptional regulator, global nitrogen regulator
MNEYRAGTLPSASGQHPFSAEYFLQAGIRVAERRLGHGALIYSPGDTGEQLYFLLEGTVRLYRTYGEHKEATVALLKEGDVFGELSLEAKTCQSVFAETVTASRVAVVRKPDLGEAIRRHPEFAIGLFSAFSERLKQSDEKIEILLNRGVATRLAALLWHLSDRFGEPDDSGMALRPRLTHQDLANMVASTREAVSKVMSEFQRGGLIEVRGRRLIVSSRLAEASPGNLPLVPGAAA